MMAVIAKLNFTCITSALPVYNHIATIWINNYRLKPFISPIGFEPIPPDLLTGALPLKLQHIYYTLIVFLFAVHDGYDPSTLPWQGRMIATSPMDLVIA